MLQQSKDAYHPKRSNNKQETAFTRKYSRPLHTSQSSLCSNPYEHDALCSMLHLQDQRTFVPQVVVVDPVIADDGHTYERTAIQDWLQGSSLSPVTRGKLPHTRLVPNVQLKSALAQHAQSS